MNDDDFQAECPPICPDCLSVGQYDYNDYGEPLPAAALLSDALWLDWECRDAPPACDEVDS